AFAAWIQEDIEHMVAYSIVQDAAFVLLAFGPLDPATWQPVRTWILVFVLAKTAFAAWVLAIRARFGTRRLGELHGRARSRPSLAGPRAAPEASSQSGMAERRRSRREALFSVRARSSVQAPRTIQAPPTAEAPSAVQVPPAVQARSSVQRRSPIQAPSSAATR